MQLRYRPLIAGDVAAISRVHRRACLVAYRFMGWDFSEAEIAEWYADRRGRWDWTMAAEAGETAVVVAYIALCATHVDQLFVDPAWHGQGIGTQLLLTALVQTGGAATLTVFAENHKARRFYEKHGFSEVRRGVNPENQAVELTYATMAGGNISA